MMRCLSHSIIINYNYYHHYYHLAFKFLKSFFHKAFENTFFLSSFVPHKERDIPKGDLTLWDRKFLHSLSGEPAEKKIPFVFLLIITQRGKYIPK